MRCGLFKYLGRCPARDGGIPIQQQLPEERHRVQLLVRITYFAHLHASDLHEGDITAYECDLPAFAQLLMYEKIRRRHSAPA